MGTLINEILGVKGRQYMSSQINRDIQFFENVCTGGGGGGGACLYRLNVIHLPMV